MVLVLPPTERGRRAAPPATPALPYRSRRQALLVHQLLPSSVTSHLAGLRVLRGGTTGHGMPTYRIITKAGSKGPFTLRVILKGIETGKIPPGAKLEEVETGRQIHAAEVAGQPSQAPSPKAPNPQSADAPLELAEQDLEPLTVPAPAEMWNPQGVAVGETVFLDWMATHAVLVTSKRLWPSKCGVCGVLGGGRGIHRSGSRLRVSIPFGEFSTCGP